MQFILTQYREYVRHIIYTHCFGEGLQLAIIISTNYVHIESLSFEVYCSSNCKTIYGNRLKVIHCAVYTPVYTLSPSHLSFLTLSQALCSCTIYELG